MGSASLKEFFTCNVRRREAGDGGENRKGKGVERRGGRGERKERGERERRRDTRVVCDRGSVPKGILSSKCQMQGTGLKEERAE